MPEISFSVINTSLFSPDGVVYKGSSLKRLGRSLRAGGGRVLLVCALAAAAGAQQAPANPNAPPPNCGQPSQTEQAEAKPAPGLQPTAPTQSTHLSGEVPLAQRPYQSLTPKQKFTVFVQQIYSPYTLGTVAFNALQAQASGDWYTYGGGMQGYGKRYGASLANDESGVFFGWFLYPTLFHQDPRYPLKGTGNFFGRAAYAMSRVLITRGDSGKQQFNYSLVMATFTASGVANAYYPRNLRGFGNTVAGASMGLVSDAGMNMLREFWPDIRNRLRKHEPERIKKMEEKPAVAKIERAIEGVPPGQPPQTPCPPPDSLTSGQSGRP
jgi:hypothetical protein